MTPREFCELVEAQLGWEGPLGEPWLRFNLEGHKVKKKIATNPSLYTWENLRLAVALLAREKKSRTPLGVFAHVERALDLALDHEDEVEEEIRKVIAYEEARGDPAGWAIRFARTDGHHRREALAEWRWEVR